LFYFIPTTKIQIFLCHGFRMSVQPAENTSEIFLSPRKHRLLEIEISRLALEGRDQEELER